MQRSSKSLLILLGIFAISVIVRAPHINRPLSTNYEWVTAHTLVTLQIWQAEGMIAHGLRPAYTFPNPNDHFIKCPISGVSDDAGNYYYVSYPPFAFIFPHLIFKTLGIYPDVLALETLNLGLHFICAFLIYLVLSTLSENSKKTDKKNNSLSLPALFGASIYIFAPLTLWHHANVYFSDVLVQTLFILGIYLSLLCLSKSGLSRKILTGTLFFVTFLMVYTEWIGFLFAGALVLWMLLYRKKSLFPGQLAFVVILAAILAGITMLWQYSGIDGMQSYLDSLLNRFDERSGHSGPRQFYQLNAHLYLLNLYLRNYFPQFVILFFLGWLMLLIKPRFRSFSHTEKMLLWLALVPTLLHHLVLFEFTLVHDMALVKTCVFMSLLGGMLLQKIADHLKEHPGVVLQVIPYTVLTGMFVLSGYLYHAHVIEPEGFSFQELGGEIRENAGPEDTVFFKTTRTLGDFLIKAPENYVIAPQIQYYAGRCIQVVPSIEAAEEHLKTYNKSSGVIFTIENSHYKIENIDRISLGQEK